MNVKQLMRIGALLIAVFALISIIVSVVNVNKSLSSMTDLSPEEAIAVENQFNEGGMDMDSAFSMLQAVSYGMLVITSVFSIIKIVVGLLILKNTERSHKFFLSWGIVFLIFGIFGLGAGVSLLGLCNLLSGIVGPVLLVIGSAQMKKSI